MPFVPGRPAVPGLLLHHSALLWRSTLADALEPLELTPTQFFLLASLYWLGRNLGRMPSQRELADHAGLDRMMTSQLSRALAARGLIARRDDAADRRAFRIMLTPDGGRLARRAIDVVRKADTRFFAGLGGGERQELIRALGHLLHEAGTSPPLGGTDDDDDE